MGKKFNAVEFQRKVREEMSKEYTTNRQAFLQELKKKYGHLQKHKVGTHFK